MRPDLERLVLIERQLAGGPGALPAADWHLRCLLDGGLAADAAAQQQLYRGLHLAGQRQLRAELRVIHARLYGPSRRRWLAWPRLALAWLRAHCGLAGG